jgi:hypothetical protein
MLTKKDGTVKGDRRRTPLAAVVSAACIIAGKPPTPESNDRCRPLKLHFRGWPPLSLADRLLCGENRHLDEAIHLLPILVGDEPSRVKSCFRIVIDRRNHAAYFRGNIGHQSIGQSSDPGSTGNETVPDSFDTTTKRGDDPHSSYDNTLCGIHLQAFS